MPAPSQRSFLTRPLTASVVVHGLLAVGLALQQPAQPLDSARLSAPIEIEVLATRPLARAPASSQDDTLASPSAGRLAAPSAPVAERLETPTRTPTTERQTPAPNTPTPPRPRPAAPTSPATAAGSPTTTPSAPSALSMRTASRATAARAPAVDEGAGVPTDVTGAASGVPALGEAAAQAALAVIDDPGPTAPPSPLELPRRERKRAPELPLIPNGDGTYRHEESVFTANIGRDGRVTNITDRPNLQVRVANLSDIKEQLSASSKDSGDGDGDGIDRAAAIPIIMGTFDLTDAVMRWAGQDPYAHRKARFLDQTRGFRAGLAAAEHSRTLQVSLGGLRSFLRSVWRDQSRPRAERRRILFMLWDECIERGDSEAAVAGRRARATIIAFIRRQLPADSPHAYRADELAELNQGRSSRAEFAPYRDASGAGDDAEPASDAEPVSDADADTDADTDADADADKPRRPQAAPPSHGASP